MTLDDFPEFGKVPQAAGVLGISNSQAWRMVWSGELPSIRLTERIVRIPKAGLVEWLERKASVHVA